MIRRRVAITGVGLVSCLGNDYDQVVSVLREGRSGLKYMSEWEPLGIKSLVAGAIADFESKLESVAIPKRLLSAMSTAATYCCTAAHDAVADAGLGPEDVASPRTACIMGSGISSVQAVYEGGDLVYNGNIARVSPYTVLRSMASSASAAVSNFLGIHGRSYSISSACATSAHSIGSAYELIRYGIADRAIAGGGEEVHPLITASFQAMRMALSQKYNNSPQTASRPYDRGRDGFVIGGGGGALVLEDMELALARGARIRAELIGFGTTSDGYDLVLPDKTGHWAAECMRHAISDAGLRADEISLVNTHGTGTIRGDVAEVVAMKSVFGPMYVPPFSSTKSMTGHPLGAAGALEAIFSVAMLENSFIAPSINIENLDPEFSGMNIVTEPLAMPVYTVMSNSFGFGGTNASLVFGRPCEIRST
jgi:3-oxoacyl-[acyl-carrier-protein] synthase-1